MLHSFLFALVLRPVRKDLLKGLAELCPPALKIINVSAVVHTDRFPLSAGDFFAHLVIVPVLTKHKHAADLKRARFKSACRNLPVLDQPLIDIAAITKFTGACRVQLFLLQRPDLFEAGLQQTVRKMLLIQSHEAFPWHQQDTPKSLAAISQVEPFERRITYYTVLVKMIIDNAYVVDLRMPVFTCHGNGIQNCRVAGQPFLKEIRGFRRRSEERIIIKIHELFRQALNAVEIQFNGMGIKGRQKILWDILIMPDDSQLWMFCVQR